MAKAVFLDRDGVLNVDTGYVHNLSEWQWIPGTIEGLCLLRQAGWQLIVVSNQSGIGRGYFSAADVDRLHALVNAQLAARGAAIDAWYYCPHAPDELCLCRKPLPGLILQAARDRGVGLHDSWMLGDKPGDVLAGLAAGTRAGILGSAPLPENVHAQRWANLGLAAADIAASGMARSAKPRVAG